MKVAVVGSRTFSDYNKLKAVLDGFNISTIVSGGAYGADKMGERYAKENNLKTIIHLPDYDNHGRGAPLIRNTEIINDAEMVVSFWDGESRGTRDAMKKAHKQRKNLMIIYI